MKRISLVIIFLICVLSALDAQNPIRNIWLSMPEQHFPYLKNTMRKTMLEKFESGEEAIVENSLEGNCVMERLTDNYLRVQMGTAAKLEMKLFESAVGDTLLCVVKTLITADVSESEVMLCSPDWSTLNRVPLKRDALLFVPDTLSSEEQTKVSRMLTPLMITVSLSENEPSCVERVSHPILSDEEKRWLTPLLVERKHMLLELTQEQ